MGKLQEVLDGFANDDSWNTENPDGSRRFDNEIKWIESMVKSYAEYFHMKEDEVIEKMEEKRTYSWPNYYQRANFPDVENFKDLVGIYKTAAEFDEYASKNFKGFKCPSCGSISDNPQECIHRIKKDGKCDWCSYGFLKGPHRIMILESGFSTIPIFEPVLSKENTNNT